MEIVAAMGSVQSETPSEVGAWAKNDSAQAARLGTGTQAYLARDSGRKAGAVALPHVLVVDEDAQMRQSIADYLGENELRVTPLGSAQDMRKAVQEHAIDLVVLDLCWWGADGVQHAWALREHSSVPIIIVSGRKHEADRVMGLESGADDYLTKPFSLRELLARVRALLRRSRLSVDPMARRNERRAYRFAGWELNLRTRRLVEPGGKPIALSNRDFNLLEALCSAPQRVLSRDQLLELSRLHSTEVYDRAIDVQILRLRRKIEPDPSKPVYIKTQRGLGYVFDMPVEIVQ
jgi:DNA-binding response OmpR family regulator